MVSKVIFNVFKCHVSLGFGRGYEVECRKSRVVKYTLKPYVDYLCGFASTIFYNYPFECVLSSLVLGVGSGCLGLLILILSLSWRYTIAVAKSLDGSVTR